MGFYLEKQALIASGINHGQGIAEYRDRLSCLLSRFTAQEGLLSPALKRAKKLFDWLWKEKPRRYRPGGNFRLNRVIDDQIRTGPAAVGNCLGLTLLYNCLLKRIGIAAGAVYLEYTFETAPHLITLLQIDETSVDIENTTPDGFDYKGYKKNPSRIPWGDPELVADIYHSIGNEHFEKGEFSRALNSYNKALELYPGYGRALLNKTILMDRMG